MSRPAVAPPQNVCFQTLLAVRVGDLNYGGHLANDAVLRLGTRRDLLTRISHLTTFEEFYYFLATNPLTES